MLIDSSEVTLGDKLGAGAFGIVFRAVWHGTKVAVKQIKKSAIERGNLSDDKARAEFESELSLMSSLQNHRNVVCFYGLTHLAAEHPDSTDLAVVVECKFVLFLLYFYIKKI